MFSTSNMHTLRNNYVHITSTKHVCVWIITYFQLHIVQIWAFFYFSHFTFTYVLRFYKAFNFDLPNSKFTWYDMWLWLRLKLISRKIYVAENILRFSISCNFFKVAALRDLKQFWRTENKMNWKWKENYFCSKLIHLIFKVHDSEIIIHFY